MADNPGTYLGIRSSRGKTKCGVLGYIKERVALMKSWKQQLLSMGVREILIKAVACFIPAYVMASLFQISQEDLSRTKLDGCCFLVGTAKF